jgi:outer membrane protein OmpA-like peptidoglycan-associated protein
VVHDVAKAWIIGRGARQHKLGVLEDHDARLGRVRALSPLTAPKRQWDTRRVDARCRDSGERAPIEPAEIRRPPDGPAGRILALQRAAGNHAVGALLRAQPRRTLQRLGDEKRKPEGLTCPVPDESPPPETDRLLFPNAVSALTDLHRQQLENLVYNWHAEGVGSLVRVDGYASAPGEHELNWPLSCDRANAVAAELQHPSSGQAGIPPELISVFMHGETKEFGPAAQNRRVSIHIATPVPPPAVSPWWPDGPTVARKQKETALDDYVRWVREVEALYPNREEVVKRLRRLTYSTFTRPIKGRPDRVNAAVAGPRFDQLTAGDTASPPLTSPPLSLTALNGLFATDVVVTPSGDKLDPAHILPMFDVTISGPTTTGAVVETVGGVRLAGVFTWTGDLASWFTDWTEHRPKTPASTSDIALLLSRVNSKTSKEDLLSDMDAQIMAAEAITTTFKTRRRRDPEAAVYYEERYDFRTFMNRPLSDVLVAYYGGSGSTVPRADVNRFPRFVRSAIPYIPHEVPDPSRPLLVRLKPEAEDRIYDHLYATAEQFLEGTNKLTRAATPDELEDNTHVLREVAHRFTVFLETGLAKGDAPWP